MPARNKHYRYSTQKDTDQLSLYENNLIDEFEIAKTRTGYAGAPARLYFGNQQKSATSAITFISL
jgi:hypothetical protein